MKERTVNLRSRSKQVDARRAHVRLSTPMKEIFIEPRAHFEHLENHMLLPLTHAPAHIIIDYLERDWKLGQLTQCNTYTPRYGGSIPEVAYSGLLMCAC